MNANCRRWANTGDLVCPQAAAGFSVVEIMISLLLGLLVVAGVSQIYLGSKQSYRLNEAQSRLQEDGRFALEFLARSIRIAGFKSVPLPDQPEQFPANAPADSATPKFAQAQVVTGLYGTAGTASTSKVSVRFQGRSNDLQGLPVGSGGTVENSIQDCLSGSVGAGVLAINTLALDTADDELECTAFNGTTGSTTGPQPIISRVESFLVLFGVDADGDPRISRSANRYVTASAVTDWSSVVSVKVRFDLYSDDEHQNLTGTYSFFGNSYSDGRLRRRFETVISLRNNLP